jgi:YD repeat-containing protein
MTTASFDLWQAFQGSPEVWGAIQNTSNLDYVFQGVPFLIANEPARGVSSVYDARSRLIVSAILPQGAVTIYEYDLANNRVSVTTSPGLGGL